MTYTITPEEIESVLSLSAEDRAAHFVERVADWEALWGARNEEGWLVPVTSDDLAYFPVWPHPEYAQKILDTHFPGNQATEISLDDFMNKWLPAFEKDQVKVAVFPNSEWVFWNMEPADMLESLKEELTSYE